MPASEVFVDLYEVLQISPSADLETIQRVYRLLALRYHPDNRETGNSKEFELVLKSYRILSDPETRASYDSEYYQRQKLRWKIFDQGGALTARETEQRQRDGVLSLLYAKRLQETHKPGMNLREMEKLLGLRPRAPRVQHVVPPRKRPHPGRRQWAILDHSAGR